MEGAVLIGTHPLSDHKELLTWLHKFGQLLSHPLHTEGIDTAHHHVGALDDLRRFFQLMGDDAVVHLQSKIRVNSRLLNRIDDLTIKEGSDEMDFVSILRCRERQGCCHDSRSEYSNFRHDYLSF